MTISNTIFSVLSGARPVSWKVVMQEVVRKLVSRMEKRKPSPSSPYLFYFFNRFECLREEETTLLIAAKVIVGTQIVGVTPLRYPKVIQSPLK